MWNRSKIFWAAVQRLYDSRRKEKAVNGRVRERTVFIINLVTDILYVIEAVTDLILVISFEEKRKEEGADLKKIRINYNIIKTTEYCINYVAGIAEIVAVYTGAGVSSLSSFSVGPNQVSCNTRKIMESSESNVTVLSVGAGKVALQQAGVEEEYVLQE